MVLPQKVFKFILEHHYKVVHILALCGNRPINTIGIFIAQNVKISFKKEAIIAQDVAQSFPKTTGHKTMGHKTKATIYLSESLGIEDLFLNHGRPLASNFSDNRAGLSI